MGEARRVRERCDVLHAIFRLGGLDAMRESMPAGEVVRLGGIGGGCAALPMSDDTKRELDRIAAITAASLLTSESREAALAMGGPDALLPLMKVDEWWCCPVCHGTGSTTCRVETCLRCRGTGRHPRPCSPCGGQGGFCKGNELVMYCCSAARRPSRST